MTVQVKEITNDLSYAQTLSELGRRLFADTFTEATTPSNMDAYLDESYTKEIQAKELADPAKKTFVAINSEDNIMIGFCQLRQKEEVYDFVQDPEAIELQRIYVDRNFKGQGVGKLLIATCFEKALQLNKKTMWLGVWENNLAAIKFYERHGFRKVGSHIFKLGDQEDTDHVMAKKL
ncbi:MAG: acyl-CoA N-acyltransferase [Benjaminiella poitrasii]|nr:MAG: acyl-CoA N-acyltransferase [Benjaminiella poitrasii]